jgi:hypothetical protein
MCIGTEENHDKFSRLVSVPTEIKIGYLLSTSQYHYRLIQLAQLLFLIDTDIWATQHKPEIRHYQFLLTKAVSS